MKLRKRKQERPSGPNCQNWEQKEMKKLGSLWGILMICLTTLRKLVAPSVGKVLSWPLGALFSSIVSWSCRGTHYNHFIPSRLDRAMGNCKWSETFSSRSCEYLHFEGSDHRPVLVHIHATKPSKGGLFCFDRRLVNKVEVRSLVEEHWNGLTPDSESILAKICRV